MGTIQVVIKEVVVDLVVMDHLEITQRMAVEVSPRATQVAMDHPTEEADHQRVHPVVGDHPTVHQMDLVARGMVRTSPTRRTIPLSGKWRILSRSWRRPYSHRMEILEN